MALWVNWGGRALWLFALFGWPVLLAFVLRCCCPCGREEEDRGFIMNALAMYIVVLAILWYFGPVGTFEYLAQGVGKTWQFIAHPLS